MGSAFAKLYTNKQNEQLVTQIRVLETALLEMNVKLEQISATTLKCEAQLDSITPTIDRTSQVVDGITPTIERTSEALDKLAEKKPSLELDDELRENIKKYMMDNYNISWVSDSVEENVYDTILNIVFKSVKAIGL